jgi:hypothetical protein
LSWLSDLQLSHIARAVDCEFSLVGLRLFAQKTGYRQPYFPGQLEIIAATPNAKHDNIRGGYRKRAALTLKNLRWMLALLGRPTRIRRNATASITIPASKFIGVSSVGHAELRAVTVRQSGAPFDV